MTEMVRKIKAVQMPPHQLRALGLDANWNKNVSPAFVDRVVKTAEKYKGVIRELAKK